MKTSFVEPRLHGPFLPTQSLPTWTARGDQRVRSLCAHDADYRMRVLCALTLNERSRLINQAKRATLPSDQFISVRCESCDAAMTFVVTPAADDDAGWARISEEHLLTCQYVATRGVTPQEEATA